MSTSSYKQIVEGITDITEPDAAKITTISNNIKTLLTIYKYLYDDTVDITGTNVRNSGELKTDIDAYIADPTNSPTPAEISATIVAIRKVRLSTQR